MADFMAGWAHHPISRPMSAQHVRSQSSSASKPTLQTEDHRIGRATSTSALHTMARTSEQLGQTRLSPLSSSHYNDDDQFLSTLPDPRSRSISPANDSPPSRPPHPDLNDEVAALSSKLINAINHGTQLEDTLSATRHELETSRKKMRQLELEAEDHADQLARGILVKGAALREERGRMTVAIAFEKRQRHEADQAKKKMELELENLTAALFEEANKMVVAAREVAKTEQDTIQKKNDQLKAQLADTETLLRSQQEQLTELKGVMEQMNTDRDDMTNPTAPSTPGMMNRFITKEETRHSRPTSSGDADMLPSYPTSFIHLIQPVLRTDLAAYEDFASLLRISKMFTSGSRTSSGSYGGLGLGLGLGSYVGNSNQANSNGSVSSIGSNNPSPVTPTTPASTASGGSVNAAALPLKDTRFYKRALAEDIDPTLRLDTAPGLSWLARRSVLTAMCDGTLVVEPMPSSTNAKYLSAFACSLCGEQRKESAHKRTHRFRTSESESAQRYPLCQYCLARVRSCCDFLGFLRVLKDGHWRTDDEESEKAAWEESVRLREQMFWCRMGGGVVPVVSNGDKSPWGNMESEREREMMESVAELERTGEIRPRDITPITDTFKAGINDSEKLVRRKQDAEALQAKHEDSDETIIPKDLTGVYAAQVKGDSNDDELDSNAADIHDCSTPREDEKDAAESVKPVDLNLSPSNEESEKSPVVETPESKLLSITIPGAFD